MNKTINIKYLKSKTCSIHRAFIEHPNGTRKVIAIFGTVADLAEKEVIFLDEKPINNYWKVLFPENDKSSGELINQTAYKDYIVFGLFLLYLGLNRIKVIFV